jgi:hypothetical protein
MTEEGPKLLAFDVKIYQIWIRIWFERVRYHVPIERTRRMMLGYQLTLLPFLLSFDYSRPVRPCDCAATYFVAKVLRARP